VGSIGGAAAASTPAPKQEEKKDLPAKPYSPPRPKIAAAPSDAGSAPAPSKEAPADSSAIFGDGRPFGDPNWYQRWHSPYYNESHARLRAEVREWVTSEIEPNCFEWVS